MSTPYIGFSNETLNKCPRVEVGDLIVCDKCGDRHELKADDNGGEVALFYRCKGESYLGAVNHRLVVGVKSDVSGEI